MLLLVLALALPGVPMVHWHSTHDDHGSTDAHGNATVALCHTTASDPHQASDEHVHQCSVSTAIFSGAGIPATIRNHGLHQLSRIGPYTSPVFDPPERPPNRLT